MIEIVAWALFAGCVVAAFCTPILAVCIAAERLNRKINPTKEG